MTTTAKQSIAFALKVNMAALILATLMTVLTGWIMGPETWTSFMDHRIAAVVYSVCVASIAFAATLRIMMRRVHIVPMDTTDYLRKTWYVYVVILIASALLIESSRRTDDLAVLLLQAGITYAIIRYERHRARR